MGKGKFATKVQGFHPHRPRGASLTKSSAAQPREDPSRDPDTDGIAGHHPWVGSGLQRAKAAAQAKANPTTPTEDGIAGWHPHTSVYKRIPKLGKSAADETTKPKQLLGRWVTLSDSSN